MNSEPRLSHLLVASSAGCASRRRGSQAYTAAIMPFCIGQVAYFFSSWAANVWATIFPSRITKVSVANVAL